MPLKKSVSYIACQLEAGDLSAELALPELVAIVYTAASRAKRVRAYCLIGDIAGRAFNAPWLIAARAAWILLDKAQQVEALLELRSLILAMGRASRNMWLMPFVHSQLSHDNPLIVEAAINATGGLCFPELEETIAAKFLGEDVPQNLQLAAIYALGRMGALTFEDRLIPFIGKSVALSKAALTALTEMRSSFGVAKALGISRSSTNNEVMIVAMCYLAELGCHEVLPLLRRFSREDNHELRLAAIFSSRALKAEGASSASERILAALSEKDMAVRTSLARRLRTLPVNDIIENAMLLFDDDPEGIIQILGEIRSTKIAKLFLEISAKTELPIPIRVSAINAIIASKDWICEELSSIVHNDEIDEEIRVAAVHSIGGLAPLKETFDRLGRLKEHVETSIKGATLWSLQFSACLKTLTDEENFFCERELRDGITDVVDWIRRRSAYIIGHLKIKSLAPDLLNLAQDEVDRPELRAAAYIGLREIASYAEFNSLRALFRQEDDTEALQCLSRTIASTILRHPDKEFDLSTLRGKISFLIKSSDPIIRESGMRLAGFTCGGITVQAILPYVKDNTPSVREEALTALGRLNDHRAAETLFDSLVDGEPAIRECAAWALLNLGGRQAFKYLLLFITSEGNDITRQEIASCLELPFVEAEYFLPLIDKALAKLPVSDHSHTSLLQLKIKLLEYRSKHQVKDDRRIDKLVTAQFSAYEKLIDKKRYSAVMNTLRTAEALYQNSMELSNADLSSSIILWIKCLENFIHASLAPRLKQLQQQTSPDIFEYVDLLMQQAWADYRIFLDKHWEDVVEVGETTVEIPMRSMPNVLGNFQERRFKRLDLPLSVTEWARLIIFFGVDHSSGVRNLFKMATKNSDHVIRLTHNLHMLAAIRNIVTHRASIGPSTLEAFRKLYYSSFENLTKIL